MIHIAILGFGTVGSGVAEVLTENQNLISERIGEQIHIKQILDLREFPDSPFHDCITHDFGTVLNDPEISLVAEMMGGSHPAYEFSKQCLEAGKHVVTSNKEVVANYGVELLRIAAEHHVSYLFEASVGGGIPIIRPMIDDLAPNRILSVNGILNGTTNYILTQMEQDGASFEGALQEAQKMGYAEANASADIDGLDAARKIVILAALSSGVMISPNDIYIEGISQITADDIRTAKENGYAIKLIGKTESVNGKMLAMVSPRFVPLSSPIASINGVFNGILVSTDMLGDVMFYGQGAGKLPTAGAVCADIMDALTRSDRVLPVLRTATAEDVADISAYTCTNCFLKDNQILCVETLTETEASEKALALGAKRYRVL